MPKLGLTMTQGKVVKWLVPEGAEVVKGQPVVEITTEKIANVVEAPASGILRKILVAEGVTVPVLAPLAVVAAPGEAIDEFVAEILAKASQAAKAVTSVSAAAALSAPTPGPAPAVVPASGAGPGAVKVSPVAARLAEEAGIDLAEIAGSGPGGRILREDVEKAIAARTTAGAEGAEAALEAAGPAPGGTAAPFGDRVKASPAARRLAKEKGIDLSTVHGTGPDGRILTADVERAAAARPGGRVTARPTTAAAGAPGESGPVGEVRLIISRRMMESLHGTAQSTITRTINAVELVKLREALQARMEREHGLKLTHTDLVIRAVALALREHPEMNVSFDGENITRHQEINVGVAVDLGAGGLIVPVVHGAERLGLAEIAARVRALTEKARQGKLTTDDVAGGTFTVTNMGMLGVDAFTPILNPPESAILGVGRIADRPVVTGGQVVPGREMVLSLTHDHRIIDGAPAARFLATVTRYLEEPYSLLGLGGT